jgi:hypothetical protein
MIQTIAFLGSNGESQVACDEATQKANCFLADLKIDRAQYVSTETNYHTNFAEGVSVSECVITLVVDADPAQIRQWQKDHQQRDHWATTFQGFFEDLAAEQQRKTECVGASEQAF